MALFRIYHKIDLMVGVWKIEETIDELRNLFTHFELYEEGLARFTSEKRKLEWLAVRALLKELLGGEEKEIAYHPSGRPYLVYNAEMPAAQVGDIDVRLFHEFFQALCVKSGMNLHIRLLAGAETHHCLEAIFKAFAKALDMATTYDPRISGVLSTKGKFD